MSNPTVKALFIYPIKSCAGLAVAQLDFDAIGPCLDRRWMVVDPGGHMLTQRVAPRLARIRPRLAGDLRPWGPLRKGQGRAFGRAERRPAQA